MNNKALPQTMKTAVAARYGGAVDASTAREADQAAQTLVDLLSSRAASAEGRYADTG